MKITAYHVSSEAGLTVIEPSICDSETRDGKLYGASVACFTTTRYNGGLPTTTVYPRGSAAGKFGYRYTMKFYPNDFSKFLMAKTTVEGVTQVHFLLLKRDCERESKIAKFLRRQKIDRGEIVKGRSNRGFLVTNSDTTCQVKKSESDKQWDFYFPRGIPNDYRGDETEGGKAFVNVMFWHAVSVKFKDEILKQNRPFQYPKPPKGCNWWLMQLFQAIPEEKEQYRQQQLEEEMRKLKIERRGFEVERDDFENECAEFAKQMKKEKRRLEKKKQDLKEKKEKFKVEKRAFEKEKAKLLEAELLETNKKVTKKTTKKVMKKESKATEELEKEMRECEECTTEHRKGSGEKMHVVRNPVKEEKQTRNAKKEKNLVKEESGESRARKVEKKPEMQEKKKNAVKLNQEGARTSTH